MASDLSALFSGPASSLREPCSVGLVCVKQLWRVGDGCSWWGGGSSERRVRWKKPSPCPLPSPAASLQPHAPWKNDDLTSLKPCHLSPTDSLKRVLLPEQSRIPEATGGMEIRLNFQKEKSFCPCQANADYEKEKGGREFPLSLGTSRVRITATMDLNMFSLRECHAIVPSPALAT